MSIINDERIKELLKTLKKNEVRETLIENIPFAVWYKDSEGKILGTNKKFYEIFEVENTTVIGKCMSEVLSKESNGDYKKEDEVLLEKKKSFSFERKIKKNNIENILRVYKTPVLNNKNEIIGIVGMVRDITETTELKKEIERLAYTDFLTGVGNRRALLKSFEELQKEKEEICILVLDLDNFKRINDNYGHNTGDKVILETVEKLKKNCKKAKIFRIGGDEFVILWKKNDSRKNLEEMAKKILSNIRDIANSTEKYFNLSGSIGGYSNYGFNQNLDIFLLNADFALYKAKEKGKNNYIAYTESLEREKNILLNLEEDVIKAIKLEKINFHYQPQYLENGEIYGFEALFRWNSEKYSKISVVEMIKILEERNIIGIVGDYLMKKAFIFIKKINEEYKKEYVVSINISPKQLMESNFIEKVKSCIEEIGVNPEKIAFEITETTLMKEIEKNTIKLNELKDIGINIYLDDFGIGYSSFNYLVSLPVSKVKIDRSFVEKMNSSEQYKKIVKLIIDSSHSLNLTVVAEGIETLEELEMLKIEKTDFYQGHYFSKPLNEEKIKELLNKER
ncbi:MAG: EAL domain-containing protein [Fusobacteriaceae bacterium]